MDFNASGEPTQLGQIYTVGHGFLNSITEASGNHIGVYVAAVVCLLLGGQLIATLKTSLQKPGLPTINGEDWMLSQKKAKENYVANARSIIRAGFAKFGGPFYIKTDGKEQIMLPPEYIEAVNQSKGLSFTEFTRESFLSHLETFRNFRPTTPGLFEEAVMKGLTRSLPHFTKPLSDQMTTCLDRSWGNSTEWHEVSLRGDVLDWVARLSARIFVGSTLAENEEWLSISVRYTVNAFQAVQQVKMWPSFLQRFAQYWEPLCGKVREDFKKSAEIIKPILAERKQEIALAEKQGRKPNLPDDSIEWFRNAAHGREYSDTDIQLGLGVAAIHTTSDLLGQSILNLCKHPEIVAPLREEAISVLSKYGWQKVALTEVRLLDSFLKETQREKPIGMASMHRLATSDVELPGGIHVKKGQHLAISSHRMWSEDVYGADVDQFDAFRFVKRRQVPELQHSSHFVSTSKDHLGFSHGKHACPGRFFAANETKIAMLHLLLKYDFKIDDVKTAAWIETGVQMTANPFAKIQVRRRKEEIDLNAL